MSGCFSCSATIPAIHLCNTCVALALLCRPPDAAFLSADLPYTLKTQYVDGLNSSNLVVGLFFFHPFHHFISALVHHTCFTTENCLAAQFLAVKEIKNIWGVKNGWQKPYNYTDKHNF